MTMGGWRGGEQWGPRRAHNNQLIADEDDDPGLSSTVQALL
jgi:hypothetical protein